MQSSAEREELLCTVATLTEERDQLKMDLQENVEMVSSLGASVTDARVRMHVSVRCVQTDD